MGIPTDKLETIFQEFAQIDISTTRKVGGTGLGLPISRRLVEIARWSSVGRKHGHLRGRFHFLFRTAGRSPGYRDQETMVK